MSNDIEIKVEDVQVGDFLKFPNSRHAQEVEQIKDDAGGSITLFSGAAQWVVKRGLTVRKVAEASDGE